MLYPSYTTVYVRRTLYSMAHDSFSLSWHMIVLAFLTAGKTGKMQSTINQLKHRKDVLYVQ